jgi:release factor glutamine methyltransferase
VCTSEKEKMAKNVLDYDPALALFVKDEAPLIFYERIVRYSFLLLKPGGSLYVEINERFGKEVCDLFERAGYIGVSLYKDIQRKDRIVSGMKRL